MHSFYYSFRRLLLCLFRKYLQILEVEGNMILTKNDSFSIGKILDVATNPESDGLLFGLPVPQFYMALAGVSQAGCTP